ncbi:MAG: hypothetical protein KAJ95_08020 [Gammaproteobacteria bacterium]|nr:hypothetical protein [Gammaproteobacteria bacterium]
MTFRQYIQLLAESIGLHQIPVVRHSAEIRYFLAEDGVHHQFVTALIRDIYKKNSCGHLDAIIDPEKTLSQLSIQRSALLSEDDTDICRVRLMNQLCELSAIILSKEQVSSSATVSIENLPERVKI